MTVRFTVPGEPTGKGRPRFSTRGGNITTSTPEKTAIYENLVKLEFQRQCVGGRFPDGSQLYVDITAYYTIPKSTSKKKRAAMVAGVIRPTKKPDCDNVVKAILDSLNKVAYHDDSQVVDAAVHKYYGERPMVAVVISDQIPA